MGCAEGCSPCIWRARGVYQGVFDVRSATTREVTVDDTDDDASGGVCRAVIVLVNGQAVSCARPKYDRDACLMERCT